MDALPRALLTELDAALLDLGVGTLARVEPVGGGCVNRGARVATETGEAFFLKWNPRLGVEVFEAEAEGLRALARPGALRVPEPLAWGGGSADGGPAWLLLESEDPVEQLRQVRAALGLDVRSRLFTRCIRCNVGLSELSGAPPATVPPRVRERHRRFWTCPACRTVFWWGTHVERTCKKLGLEPPRRP